MEVTEDFISEKGIVFIKGLKVSPHTFNALTTEEQDKYFKPYFSLAERAFLDQFKPAWVDLIWILPLILFMISTLFTLFEKLTK